MLQLRIKANSSGFGTAGEGPAQPAAGFFITPAGFFSVCFNVFFGSSCHFGGSCPLSTSFGARFGIGFAVHQRSQIHG